MVGLDLRVHINTLAGYCIPTIHNISKLNKFQANGNGLRMYIIYIIYVYVIYYIIMMYTDSKYYA